VDRFAAVTLFAGRIGGRDIETSVEERGRELRDTDIGVRNAPHFSGKWGSDKDVSKVDIIDTVPPGSHLNIKNMFIV
jgi:hypothetical protein